MLSGILTMTFLIFAIFSNIFNHFLNDIIFLAYHVSRLENFLVTTFPKSMPSLSTIFCARSGCDVPEKTLMLGILEPPRLTKTAGDSNFEHNRLRARTGSANRGITNISAQSTLHAFLYSTQCSYYTLAFAYIQSQSVTNSYKKRPREKDKPFAMVVVVDGACLSLVLLFLQP